MTKHNIAIREVLFFLYGAGYPSMVERPLCVRIPTISVPFKCVTVKQQAYVRTINTRLGESEKRTARRRKK